ETVFELTPDVIAQVVKLSNAIPANVSLVEVSRDFSGKRLIYFPDATTASGIPSELVSEIISAATAKLAAESEVEVIQRFTGVTASALKGSTIAPLMLKAKQQLEGLKTALNKPAPHSIEEVRKLIVSKLPSFVYYSNYGNLDSEIYLP
nr:hypothetical protein [Tanacetum cinerariifolium]